MIYFLLSDNGIIWHIVGYILYEIILVPLLFIIQYMYWIFISIITTNVSPEIFNININNSINDNFSNSGIFIIYVSCLSISIFVFIFTFAFNVMKKYFSNGNYDFINNLKWFFITLLLFPLLPMFFCLLFLLTNLFFNLLGISNNSSDYLNNDEISSFDNNFNFYKEEIVNIWNNIDLNKEIILFLNEKLNINSFYYNDLIIQLNNYETFINNNQNIFNSISQLLSEIKLNSNNTDLISLIDNEINLLNEINNTSINIYYDLNKLDYISIANFKNQIILYKEYFDGELINNLLFQLPYSLNNLVPHLGHINNFNLIYEIESLTGNYTNIIDLTPDFYLLNWNVIIAILFSLALLIILFLYSILEIRRIVEIVVLFLITPLCFVINNDERNYYFTKWFKLCLNKFFSLLIIALIFQTALTIYPYIVNAINNNIQYHVFNKIIISCIVGIGIMLASFFSINTILGVFDAREDFMEILGDLYTLNTATKIIPFAKRIKNRLIRNPNFAKINNNDLQNKNNYYDLTPEDIIYKKIPVPTQGFEKFMASDKTHNFIKNTNNLFSSLMLGRTGKTIAKYTNTLIENKLRSKYKKYRMKEQKWKKQREEGEF